MTVIAPFRSTAAQQNSETLIAYTAQELAEKLSPNLSSSPKSRDLFVCACALAIKLAPALSARRLFDTIASSSDSFDEIDLQNTLAEIGFEASPITSSLSHLDPRLAPCLLWTKDGTPKVVLAHPNGDAFEVFDPISGETSSAASADLDADDTCRIVVFPKVREDRMSNWRHARDAAGRSWFTTQFFRFLKPIGLIVLLGFVLNLLSISVPVFILLTYDRVIGPHAGEPLIYLAIGAIIAIIFECYLRHTRAVTVSWVTSRIDFIIGTALFKKLLSMPPLVIERSLVSSQLARIKSFETVREFFAGPVFISALELPSVILSFALIYLLAGSLVSVIILSAFAYVACFLLVQNQLRSAMREAAIENSSLHQFHLDTVAKLDNIRSDGLEDLWARKHSELSARTTLAQRRLFQLGALGEQMGGLLASLTVLCVLWFGSSLIWNSSLPAAALIAVVMLSWRALAPFHALCAMIPQFEQARNAIQQIDNFMQTETPQNKGTSSSAVPPLEGAIELESVAVRHDAKSGPVFMGLNLKIKPGDIVAVSGSNGSGKSSVLRLLLGFNEPLLGTVRFDGFDLRQIDPQSIHERISYLAQEVVLFSGSIAENLRFANPLCDDATLLTALERSGALDAVMSLPDGLDTVIDRRSARSTLGELLVHRIGLARALMNNSKIILLDEQPASVLRSGFDKDLKRLIAECRGNTTLVFVTHRADFLRLATTVLSLRRGSTPKVGDVDLFLEAG